MQKLFSMAESNFIFKNNNDITKEFCSLYELDYESIKKFSTDSYDREILFWHWFDPNLHPSKNAYWLTKNDFGGFAFLSPVCYQESIAQHGLFFTISPFTGEFLYSNNGFLIDMHHIAYMFNSNGTVFFILVGRFHGRRSALVIPHLNMVLLLNSPENGENIAIWIRGSVMNLLNFLNSNVNDYEKKYNNQQTSKKIALVSGTQNNLGHYLWNDLSGVEAYISRYGVSNIGAIVTGEHCWPTPLDIFPELSNLPLIRVNNSNVISKGFELDLIPFRPIGCHITHGLRSRILSYSLDMCHYKNLNYIQSLHSKNVLLINLRAHNKVWISQIDGYSSLINKLFKKYPDLLVVFDGSSDCAEIVECIVQKAPCEMEFIKALDIPFYESIFLSFQSNCYVSVIGSGLALHSWVAGRNGVAHSNRSHLLQKQWWCKVSMFKENVYFVNDDSIQDSDGGLYCNYDFDWNELYTPICSMLDKQEFSNI